MDAQSSEQLELLREIAKWTREAAVPAVRERVEKLLDTESKKRVYEAIADGTVSVRSLENVAGVSRATAQSMVAEWEAERIAKRGANPPRALFTLEELGIPSAQPKAKKGR